MILKAINPTSGSIVASFYQVKEWYPRVKKGRLGIDRAVIFGGSLPLFGFDHLLRWIKLVQKEANVLKGEMDERSLYDR